MITAVATSGRGVELVLGVAGAGKTTALDAVRQAFETAGYRVIGTSTSGQAARTLGSRRRHRRVPHHRLPAVADRPRTSSTSTPHRGRLRRSRHDRRPRHAATSRRGRERPGRSWSSSAITANWARSAPAAASRPSSPPHRRSPSSSGERPPSRPRRASRARPAAGRQRRASRRLVRRTRPDHHRDRTGTRRSIRWSPPGPQMSRRARRRPCWRGGEPTSPPSTAEPGRPWPKPDGCPGRSCRSPDNLPGRRSHRHPRPLGAAASWSPPSGGPSPRSDPETGRWLPAWTTAEPTPSGPIRSAPTTSPSDMPPRFIEAKARPATPPTSSPTAAAENSATWP